MAVLDDIKIAASEYFAWVRAIRRHIHANPELSFKEERTSAFVQGILNELNIPFKTGFAKHGIVATIGSGTKVTALRADLDALPIDEKNDCEYKSKVAGVMHACGHDVHTASLLGAAKILKSIEDKLTGTVLLIFQPGEEQLPGGASIMLAEGALENPKPQSIFAQHVFPDLEVGKVGFRSGMYMASTDEVRIWVTGKGGHGAMPHQLIDPVLISAHLILAMQQVTSRNAYPATPTVLSFGRVEAKGSTNVIPDEVYLEGTFRTLNEEWRAEAHQKIIEIANGICHSMGATCKVRIDRGYPYLCNDENLTIKSRVLAEEYLGADNVVDLPIRMTGEDFSYFAQQMPACFYRLGVRNEEKGIIYSVHNARFDIDEEALITGSGLMAWLAYNAVKIEV
jgi:amidohydrolase